MHCLRAPRPVFIVAGFGLLLLALLPAAVGAASPYPPNTVVSTYFDARFCGDGQVSVVADQNSNLVNVCTSTGQRFDPAAYGGVPGYGYGGPGYGTGVVAPGYAYGAVGNGAVIRQYTDNNSNCSNGDVTETVSGFYCTANGQPAVSNLSLPGYYGGFVPTATNGYIPTYTTGGGLTPNYGGGIAYNGGAAIRQYNDGRSNCPNGDVTETVSGFYCTANGQPAVRVN